MRNLARISNYYNRIQAQADFEELAVRAIAIGLQESVNKHRPPAGAGWRKIDKCIAALRRDMESHTSRDSVLGNEVG